MINSSGMEYLHILDSRKINDDKDGDIGAENAILAALKLKKSFENVKNNWLQILKKVIEFDIHIDIKCGMNTGLVLVGLLRSGERD